MRALVTGGAGFLGSHLCDTLLAQGHSVICLDNLLTGRMENIEHLSQRDDFVFEDLDVCQPFDCLFGKVDAVFHLASPASPADYIEHGVATLQVGSLGTFNALELARRWGAPLLLASTSECYGDPLQHPQREQYWGNVNPIGPRSVYDEAKRFAEAATAAYRRYHNVDTKIVRIFNTYGPRLQPNDGRVISNFLRQALNGEPLTVYGDGTQSRSFCYVSDLIDGLIRMMDSDSAGPVNLGNPEEFMIGECAELVLKITGSRSKIEFRPLPQDDPQQRCPDITRARKILGWEPRIKLEEGLRLALPYFQQQPVIAAAA
jgi:dTDP-glucose 4,6-dehydratase